MKAEQLRSNGRDFLEVGGRCVDGYKMAYLKVWGDHISVDTLLTCRRPLVFFSRPEDILAYLDKARDLMVEVING